MIQRFSKLFQNGVFCMILACFFFAIMGISMKFALRKVGVAEVVFSRSILSALLIGILIHLRRDSFFGHHPKLLIGRALAGFTALSANVYAISKIPIGDATVLNQSSPIFVALFSALFLKEVLSKRVLLLTLVSMAGVCLILKPSFHYENFAPLIGLLSGVMAALAYVAIRQLHATDSSLTMAFYFTFVASLLSFPFALLHFTRPSLPTFLILLTIGISGTLGQLLLTYAYKNEVASLVAPFSYTSVLFSFLFGVYFFGEWPDFFSILGSIVVILSCIFISLTRNPKYLKLISNKKD